MIVTYESIKPLIKSENLVEGNQLHVSFQAEGMAAPIKAVGMMMASQEEMSKNVRNQAIKQGVFSSIISAVSRVLGSLIGGVGGSIASSTASTVAYSATSSSMSQGMMTAKDTPENRQKAAVAAFQTIQTYFEYDAPNGVWKGKNVSQAQS